jgi:hypothetical protein
VWLLYVRNTERWSLCEQQTSLKELKDNILREIANISRKECFLCIEEYFQQVEGLLKSWRSTLSLFFEIS